MNLAQLRADLKAVAETAGFNAWDFLPDDPQHLPAAVVGGIHAMVRLNAHVTQVQIGITFYASHADAKDATRRLDLALSTGDPNSFIDIMDAVTESDGPSWRSIRFDSCGAYHLVSMPSDGTALAVETIWELTA